MFQTLKTNRYNYENRFLYKYSVQTVIMQPLYIYKNQFWTVVNNNSILWVKLWNTPNSTSRQTNFSWFLKGNPILEKQRMMHLPVFLLEKSVNKVSAHIIWTSIEWVVQYPKSTMKLQHSDQLTLVKFHLAAYVSKKSICIKHLNRFINKTQLTNKRK